MPRSSASAKINWPIVSVGGLMGGVSILSLIDDGFRLGWTVPFLKTLDQYRKAMDAIRELVQPYIEPAYRALADLIHVDLILGPNWTDVVFLMMVYLGSRLKAYVSQGKYVRSAFMFLVSAALSLTCSLFGASKSALSWPDAFQASVIPLFGFLAYDFIYAGVGATFDRRRGSSWFTEFVRHLAFSVPLLFVCTACNLFLARILVVNVGSDAYQAFILLFLMDYALISIYWAIRSFQHALRQENRDWEESVWERFQRSSATKVAIYVGGTILSAVIFMLTNAGLREAGLKAFPLSK